MKKLPLIIGVSLLSSLLTVLLVRFLAPSPQPAAQPEIAAKYTNYAAPTAIESRVLFSAAPTNFTTAAGIATPGVVHISARSSRSGSFQDFWGRGPVEASSGSGVIISEDGYIVTNNHVIEDGSVFEVTLNDRRSLEAELIGTDPSTDLALLKVESDEPLPFLNFADSDSTIVGEWVLAVGNPFNLNSTVTAGIVSAKARNINILEGDYTIESFIQTDAAVNPGNSGGALVNTNGDLVGINTAIITRSGRYEGYSFAVPANLVQKVVLDLKDFGIVQRGFLGVLISDVTNQIAERYDLESLDGVYISRVNENSAASDAGLQEGDIITHVNGVRVVSTPELQEQVARFRPGNTISIEFLREGKQKKGEVVLKNKRNTTALIDEKEQTLFAELGFELRELDADEQAILDLVGVKVLNIKRDGKIYQTNMEPGFIITKINDKAVENVAAAIKEIKKSTGRIVLEGVYEDYPGEYYYTFNK
ncbi:MAG: trypsin-like peptidase domain-containing protein [Bacteroidota bacterium]